MVQLGSAHGKDWIPHWCAASKVSSWPRLQPADNAHNLNPRLQPVLKCLHHLSAPPSSRFSPMCGTQTILTVWIRHHSKREKAKGLLLQMPDIATIFAVSLLFLITSFQHCEMRSTHVDWSASMCWHGPRMEQHVLAAIHSNSLCLEFRRLQVVQTASFCKPYAAHR